MRIGADLDTTEFWPRKSAKWCRNAKNSLKPKKSWCFIDKLRRENLTRRREVVPSSVRWRQVGRDSRNINSSSALSWRALQRFRLWCRGNLNVESVCAFFIISEYLINIEAFIRRWSPHSITRDARRRARSFHSQRRGDAALYRRHVVYAEVGHWRMMSSNHCSASEI